jgi:hypothetical protein
MEIQMRRALEWQWANSGRKNLQLCGQIPIGKFLNLLHNKVTGEVVISGLRSCESASACVVCSSRMARDRGEVLAEIFMKAKESGYDISMLTLTVRHKKGQSLATLLGAMRQAYDQVVVSSAWSRIRDDFEGTFLRVLEVTEGVNGWHPHFHIAVIHKPGIDFERESELIYGVWADHLVRARERLNYNPETGEVQEQGDRRKFYGESLGLEAPSFERGINWVENASPLQRAWYLTKASGGSTLPSGELVGAKDKEARKGNRGIWEVHAVAVAGDGKAKALWLEYEKAVKGFRLFIPSRDFASRFGCEWKGTPNDVELASNADNIHYVK